MRQKERYKCLACHREYGVNDIYKAKTKLYAYLCRGCRTECGCSICFKPGKVFSILNSPIRLTSIQNRSFFTLCSKAACRLYIMESMCKELNFWMADKAGYKMSSEYHIIKTCFENPPRAVKEYNDFKVNNFRDEIITKVGVTYANSTK